MLWPKDPSCWTWIWVRQCILTSPVPSWSRRTSGFKAWYFRSAFLVEMSSHSKRHLHRRTCPRTSFERSHSVDTRARGGITMVAQGLGLPSLNPKCYPSKRLTSCSPCDLGDRLPPLKPAEVCTSFKEAALLGRPLRKVCDHLAGGRRWRDLDIIWP